MTSLSSFRNATGKELIRRGQASSRVSCEVTDGARELSIALLIEEGHRAYTLNGKRKQPKDLRGTLPSVVFTPDDLEIAKGSSRHRRHELDVLGSQAHANYWQIVHDYEKILRHKNRLLKDEVTTGLIEATNEVFAKVGEQLSNYREALFAKLMMRATKHYANISGGEQLHAKYVRSWDDETLLKATERLLRDERARQRSLAGPHLDEINLYIDGMDVATFASQGQQRSVVLAIKLAEAEFIEETLDQLPVLLLDDVMSELDEGRRGALVRTLLEGKQTFITTANIDYFDDEMLEKARIVKLD